MTVDRRKGGMNHTPLTTENDSLVEGCFAWTGAAASRIWAECSVFCFCLVVCFLIAWSFSLSNHVLSLIMFKKTQYTICFCSSCSHTRELEGQTVLLSHCHLHLRWYLNTDCQHTQAHSVECRLWGRNCEFTHLRRGIWFVVISSCSRGTICIIIMSGCSPL